MRFGIEFIYCMGFWIEVIYSMGSVMYMWYKPPYLTMGPMNVECFMFSLISQTLCMSIFLCWIRGLRSLLCSLAIIFLLAKMTGYILKLHSRWIGLYLLKGHVVYNLNPND